MLATDVLIASEGLFTEDALKDALLITIPTIGLTIATVWANDRLAKIALAAIRALVPPVRKRGRHKTKPALLAETTSRHIGFEENHVEKRTDWDKELAALSSKDNHLRNTLND